MAGPIDGSLGLSQDHLALRDAVRTFAQRHVSSEQMRVQVEAEASLLPKYWAEAADSGLLGLHVAEQYGGSGYGLLETCVVAEELGAHLAPGPFLGTVTLSAALHQTTHVEHLPGLVDGSLIGAVAPHGTVSVCRLDGDLVLSGSIAPTPGLPLADLALVATDRGWVLLTRAEWGVSQDQPGLDLTRWLGSAELSDVRVPADRLLDLPAHRVEDLLALFVSAEACGSAGWSTRTAAEYAGVREQFGRAIGGFQGVKHRCATMLIRTEQARVVTWDAARALDQALDAAGAAEIDSASFAVAVAASIAPQAALQNAKAVIDTLGAIGYTWEHDASFHLRRSRTTTVLIGGSGYWRQRVGESALSGVRRDVGIDLPPEAETIRGQIRAELGEALAGEVGDRTRFLAEHGYVSPHLPAPWGKGADAVTQLVIAEELRRADLKPHNMIIGNWVIPTLVQHGSVEQQEQWIPPSLRGDLFWCQLFSEPGAGSDLAALSTRAEKVEGGWRINGSKIWTSAADHADVGILLARTEPDAVKHAGISYFLMDMKAPGIDIRPIREITGASHFTQVFLDDVFIPDDRLVGSRGEGWKLARTTLANERVALGSGSLLGSAGEAVLAVLGQDPSPGQDDVRTLGRVLADAQSISLFGLRSAIRSVSGSAPGAESSVAKLIGVTHTQEAWEIAVEWGGMDGLVRGREEEGSTWWFLNARNQSIAGGTIDVQLNIIGERLLGLPRDASN